MTDARPVEAYETTEPKQFGNLHERMKYVISLTQQHKKEVPNDLWHAIWDLELEVSYYKPANPPYGSRRVRLEKK